MIKDRNKDLKGIEEIRKRWQEYIRELYKKGLNDPLMIAMMEAITNQEADILECVVKWALGSITMIKAGKGDGIQAELFKILKDNAIKVLHSLHQQIGKSQPWPLDWKQTVFIPIPKKDNAKECSNYCTISYCILSHATKVMLKVLQTRLQQNFQIYKLGLEKAEEPEIKLPTSVGSCSKQRNFRKNIYFCFIDYTKAFDCVGHNKLWKILKAMKVPNHLTCLLRNLWVKKQLLELDMKQMTGSKL